MNRESFERIVQILGNQTPVRSFFNLGPPEDPQSVMGIQIFREQPPPQPDRLSAELMERGFGFWQASLSGAWEIWTVARIRDGEPPAEAPRGPIPAATIESLNAPAEVRLTEESDPDPGPPIDPALDMDRDRYQYRLLTLSEIDTWLLRDDGCRFDIFPLRTTAVNIDREWHFLMEYKQFDWPAIASGTVDLLLYHLPEPAESDLAPRPKSEPHEGPVRP